MANRADLTSSPQRTFVPNLMIVSQFARLFHYLPYYVHYFYCFTARFEVNFKSKTVETSPPPLKLPLLLGVSAAAGAAVAAMPTRI